MGGHPPTPPHPPRSVFKQSYASLNADFAAQAVELATLKLSAQRAEAGREGGEGGRSAQQAKSRRSFDPTRTAEGAPPGAFKGNPLR